MENDESAGRPTPSAERKPYTPPRIEESGRFETLVLNCTLDIDLDECRENPTPSSLG